MRFSRIIASAAFGATVVFGAAATQAAADAADAANPAVEASLKTIQHDADEIAAGHYSGKQLQAPAHEIGVEWYKVEPILAKNGSVLVETRMANASITTFGKSWQQPSKARSAAKDVSSSVADLLTATKTSAQPAPAAASGSPAASPAASPAPSSSPG